jgi:hypothetical protein
LVYIDRKMLLHRRLETASLWLPLLLVVRVCYCTPELSTMTVCGVFWGNILSCFLPWPLSIVRENDSRTFGNISRLLIEVCFLCFEDFWCKYCVCFLEMVELRVFGGNNNTKTGQNVCSVTVGSKKVLVLAEGFNQCFYKQRSGCSVRTLGRLCTRFEYQSR